MTSRRQWPIIESVGVSTAGRLAWMTGDPQRREERVPMDLRRLIAIIRPWLPVIAACSVLAGGVAFVASGMLPKSYSARVTLIVGQSLSSANPEYNQLLVSQRLSATYAAVATTRPILEAVIDEVGLNVTPPELAKRVHASAPLDSTLLMLSAEDEDPDRAAAIANTLATQLIAESPTIQGRQVEFQASIDAALKSTVGQIDDTQTQVDILAALPKRTAGEEAELQALQGRLVTLRSTYAALLAYSSDSATNLLKIIEPAEAPLEPESPRPLLNAVLAAILGLLAVGSAAFLVEYLDDSVKDPDTVRSVAGLGTLCTVARIKGGSRRSEIYRLVTLLYPRSPTAEAYRTLRSNIEFASIDAPVRSILVTSAIPGEGKTVTAANLAVAFAQANRQVLLVDADLRKPGTHLIFDLQNDQGLTSMVRSDDAALDTLANATEVPGMRVLTSGPLPPNPAELIGSQRMRAVMGRLADACDLVVVDGPPLQAVTDSAILSSYLDATILVVDAERGRRHAVRFATEALARAGANVLGAVLNRVPRGSQATYAGYDLAYYGNEQTADEAERPFERRDMPEEPHAARPG
jgi:non-specific protein-tyrosine kinase